MSQVRILPRARRTWVGTGHNGADALLAGVRLRRRGVRVDALLIGDHAYEPGLRQLSAAGGRVIAASETDTAIGALEAADLIVDGIIGESGTGGLTGYAAKLVAAIPSRAQVVAVDLPSGVEPDSGETHGTHVRADITVTFAAWKACTFLPPASNACGELRFVDVGLPRISTEPIVRRLTDRGVANRWPIPATNSHKYLRGVLGVVAGSDIYPGAAVLAVMCAKQAGAGIVRYVGPDRVTGHVLTEVPEAVPGVGQVQAWLLGSGVEDDAEQDHAIGVALTSGLPCVVDAGALEAFVRHHDASEHASGADRVLLTPHAGEMARILGWLGRDVSRAEVEARPAHFGLMVARAVDATVLVKGATTIAVRPDGLIASQAEAPSWLATAGAGDVLAGIAGALMSGGIDAFDAGEMAAFIHGRAARLAHHARGGGPITASSVAEATPTAIGAVLAARQKD
ncbi:bifunctional ADP-dependent NAD(P)H-hydrate dehydratase/NAD(P)H-hydrate epimerase [Nocardia amikacinitolerans]|uniref:bifunctional ADP-dependent NAD(P)H-hydrate dehydratase/NAD(P)H-hydrate epimerase n=1 Tax=Nocardia amikacinitolerans TaxID=756689 RepID=UPI0020A5ABFC|nr:bifunctional ADP-dependent NAD(P)H-hydrate dehydratase/NAD(P)H-hydrate epimerase [Nocardia amikacinitolerans]